jgi:hypothetical protein
MISDKRIVFSGLELPAKKLLKKRVSGMFVSSWHRTYARVPSEYRDSVSKVVTWLEENCTERFSLSVESNRSHTSNSTFGLFIAFENGYDAMMYKLIDVSVIIQESDTPKD